MKKKATLITREVAWSNDIPTKYQAFLEYSVSDRRIIRLAGDPMSTEEAAENSLINEYMLWHEAMASFKEIVNKKENETNN